MKLFDILQEETCCEEVYVDEDGNILSEAAVRQFKIVDKKITKRFRCTSGPKKGKLVANPSACSKRPDPKKVRQGRATMRSKKGVVQRKAKVSKKKAMNRIVAKMNARLTGK